MSERDSKRIIRQWDREIEAEARRRARDAKRGPWRAVVWAALWLLWLLLLLGLFVHLKGLR